MFAVSGVPVSRQEWRMVIEGGYVLSLACQAWSWYVQYWHTWGQRMYVIAYRLTFVTHKGSSHPGLSVVTVVSSNETELTGPYDSERPCLRKCTKVQEYGKREWWPWWTLEPVQPSDQLSTKTAFVWLVPRFRPPITLLVLEACASG
jgi:hypothetical protein